MNHSPPTELHEKSQRAHERLIAYWEHLRQGRAYPREDEVEPSELAGIWDDCFLLTLNEGGKHEGYRYEYMGHGLLAAYGRDMTGLDSDHENAPQIASMLASVAHVAASGKPSLDQSAFVNARGVEIRYRSCLLPLAGTGEGVEYVLGCMRWREM